MISTARAEPGTLRWRCCAAASIAAMLLALGAGSPCAAAGRGGETFASPEQAAQALSEAWRNGRTDTLLKIFGPAGQKLVLSGDPVAERRARERFATAYDQRHRIEAGRDGEDVLIIGDDDWPYPVPIVRQGGIWRFDAEAGMQQILDRRVGHNELHAIMVCRAYAEAQREYAAKDRQGDGLHQFAQQVASTPGKHDGLYWPATTKDEESPLGPLVAAAEAKGYPPPPPTAGGRAPFEGYYFRILKGQGSHAPGGAKSYLADGHMTLGFAMIAFPARWGDSGVMTFVVNQAGIVFEKNLGPQTSEIARSSALYDPDRGWRIASSSGPQR